jgi:hypothetical protein
MLGLSDGAGCRASHEILDRPRDEDLRRPRRHRSARKRPSSSGLARTDGEFRSIRVAVTPHDFVLFDNWTHLDPDTELKRLPRDSITDAVIVDETGNEVADQLLDPIHQLETPEEERYAVVLKRHGANGELLPVSFIFHSGEPALECRDGYRRFITPRG